jgi:hypothetical protein
MPDVETITEKAWVNDDGSIVGQTDCVLEGGGFPPTKFSRSCFTATNLRGKVTARK